MVEIKTERLLLREYREGDASRIAEIANNKKIARNLVNSFPHPYTLGDAEGWIKIAREDDKIKTHFVIVLGDEVIGTVSFNPQDDEKKGTAIAGYWLGEDYWGKGYGTEAFRAMVDYAFENFDIRKIQAGVFSWNSGSANILKKCGFKKEAELREYICKFDEVCDELSYGLLRKEWGALKNGA